jgi:hypothetical protein
MREHFSQEGQHGGIREMEEHCAEEEGDQLSVPQERGKGCGLCGR